MTWITDNWVVILLGVGFTAFHLFGHRGHGGHGGHGGGHKHSTGAPPVPPPLSPTSIPPSGMPLASDPDAVADEDFATRPPTTGGHQH